MDVLCVISNCPQINNPCNGFNPTPIRVLIWDVLTECSERFLIANRGEIAARIVRTLQRAWASRRSPSIPMPTASRRRCAAADRSECGSVRRRRRESYLNVDAIIAACRATGARGGASGLWLSLRERRLSPSGSRPKASPSSARGRSTSEAFGLKHTARDIARASGVPLLPGSGLLETASSRRWRRPTRIGYPVMLKSTAGGGGIGMQLCRDADELAERFEACSGSPPAISAMRGVYLERFVARARHVEVQIFGDGKGGVVALGERDCSLQRRNQKVIEETPAPDLQRTRARRDCTRRRSRSARAVSYESAGTVEFIYDVEREEFYFLEVNTRLQVEHPVTEEVFGVDLVEWMIRQAAGRIRTAEQGALRPRGHAIEVRLYAEDPGAQFPPSAGVITGLSVSGRRADRQLDRDRARRSRRSTIRCWRR